jgi:hypothetical protein
MDGFIAVQAQKMNYFSVSPDSNGLAGMRLDNPASNVCL